VPPEVPWVQLTSGPIPSADMRAEGPLRPSWRRSQSVRQTSSAPLPTVHGATRGESTAPSTRPTSHSPMDVRTSWTFNPSVKARL